MIGIITSCGGGTIRDVFIGKQPFWFEEWEYIVMAGVTALLVFCFWEQIPNAPVPSKSEYSQSQSLLYALMNDWTIKGPDGGEGSLMKWGDHIAFGGFAVIGKTKQIANSKSET
jgi:uncharacterized membrane protein YeiH